MKGNWIKLHREMLDNPTVMKDGDHLAVWIWLLMNATSKRRPVRFGGEQIYLQPGELTTGRKAIASALRISEYKVQRILSMFENAQQIAQRTDRQCRLITILNWNEYQQGAQRFAQDVHNEPPTNRQRPDTKQEYKNRKNRESVPHPPTLDEVSKYVEEKGYEINPEAFFDYYEETDWLKKNGQPIRDWRASVRTWARREKEFKKTGQYGNGSKPEVRPPKVPDYDPEYFENIKKGKAQMPDELRRKIEGALK